MFSFDYAVLIVMFLEICSKNALRETAFINFANINPTNALMLYNVMWLQIHEI